MRLFVAIPLPAGAVEVVRRFPRPEVASLRWTTAEQWHVTLRFIGEVSDPHPVSEALVALAGAGGANPSPLQAVMGPASAWFPGRRVLQVPVAGLDGLAAAVTRLTAPWGRQPGPEKFNGHLTLARTRGKTSGPLDQAGIPVAAQWRVDHVALYSSILGSAGAEYEPLTVVDL